MNRKYPVSIIRQGISDLRISLDEKDWDKSNANAQVVLDHIPLAISIDRCNLYYPSLDGVFCVGTQSYLRAPKELVRKLNKMNRIIKTARKNMPKKRK